MAEEEVLKGVGKTILVLSGVEVEGARVVSRWLLKCPSLEGLAQTPKCAPLLSRTHCFCRICPIQCKKSLDVPLILQIKKLFVLKYALFCCKKKSLFFFNVALQQIWQLRHGIVLRDNVP